MRNIIGRRSGPALTAPPLLLGLRSARGRPTGKTNKPGWVRWTDNERQTLAGLIAKSATLQQAYADFSRQVSGRSSGSPTAT